MDFSKFQGLVPAVVQDADSSEVLGEAVRADITVTFSALKHCLVFPPAHKWAGEIVVADIGNPPASAEVQPSPRRVSG